MFFKVVTLWSASAGAGWVGGWPGRVYVAAIFRSSCSELQKFEFAYVQASNNYKKYIFQHGFSHTPQIYQNYIHTTTRVKYTLVRV